MAVFTGISQTISSFFTPRKPVLQQRNPPGHASSIFKNRLDEEPLSPFTKAKDWLEASPDDHNLESLEGDTLFEDVKQSGKRSAPSRHVEDRSAKRRKTNDGYHPGNDDGDSDFEGETLLASTPALKKHVRPSHKAQEDREAMPPPPKPAVPLDDKPYIPAIETIDRNLQSNIVLDQPFLNDSSMDEDEIFTKKTRVRREDRSEVNLQFEYDRALRHAHAQQVPDGSGIWSETETDLFYRLAMRGFEPLLPGHWTVDFKTLPHTLFSVEGNQPLILPFSEREFRAKHYLRTLFNIAARVRDRRLANLRTEPILKRTLSQYLSWALRDAGLHPTQRPKVIPVHAVATMRTRETTHDVLRRMSKKLYKLAARYQDVHRIRQSIEPVNATQSPNALPTPPNSNETSFSSKPEPSCYDDSQMPTLIGLMIASSVVAVVTLDSRSSPPEPPLQTNDAPNRRSSSSSSLSSFSTQEESLGLRFIEKFDFSTHDGYDVWDGLAMAICIMRIRKTMLELCERAAGGKAEMWERVWAN